MSKSNVTEKSDITNKGRQTVTLLHYLGARKHALNCRSFTRISRENNINSTNDARLGMLFERRITKKDTLRFITISL